MLFAVPVIGLMPREPRCLGTKRPYTAPVLAYTPPPAGYNPVFINYAGRHGARFLTKAGADLRVWEVLQAAEKNHSLTALGKQVMAMTEKLLAMEKDKYEQITVLGKEEQTAIGERMLYNYGGVFTGKGLEIVTTYKLRTQQSAEAFLQGFAKVPGLRRYEKAADSLDTVLRFYDLSPAYQRYKKSSALRLALDSLEGDKRTKEVAAHICKGLFTGPLPQVASTGKGQAAPKGKGLRKGPGEMDPVAFADNLYDLYSVQFSLPGEMQERGYVKDSIDLGIAFGRKDLEWLDYRSGAQDFLEKGPGYDPMGIQVRVAAPLLADFIHSTDQAVRRLGSGGASPGTANGSPTSDASPASDVSSGPDAILRFTHAEAISPFAALLGIPEAGTPAASIFGYRAHWQTESIIPLSANIQWILYTNGKDWLVKVLLNEKEAALPLKTTSFPYYRWKDLKDYYEKRLQSLHAGAGENMLEYLKTLR